MSKIHHDIVYDHDAKVFECIQGYCSWTCTEDQLREAGYSASRDHIHFVKEDDFAADTEQM